LTAALPATRLPIPYRSTGFALIRLGIVGCNYGRVVHLPAFRSDPRCHAVALAGTDAARTAEIARQAGVDAAYGDWHEMIERPDIDVIAIATPPQIQPTIAARALESGKAVFVEKPMAADLAGAASMLKVAGNIPTMIDFNFTELPAWKKAKAMLDAGAIGKLRHVVVNWNVENLSTQRRLKNWKTSATAGGGALGNLASHSMHYFEWLCGPIAELSATLASLPDEPGMEVTVQLALGFSSGATGTLALSCASYLGSGHRLEFYGEDGALVLMNLSPNFYMRGFTLSHARRPAAVLSSVEIETDPRDIGMADDRVAPVSRLAQRFLDAIEQRGSVSPNFSDGYRVQFLLDAARRSHKLGRRVDTKQAEVR
jgi:predicted dehydrogenase